MRKIYLCLFFAVLQWSFKDVAEAILLRSSTSVSLELKEEVNSEAVTRGNLVEFLVKNDVTVNGRIVIAAGSLAEGVVKDVVKLCRECSTKCAKVTFTVENVQAVDGQRVYLRSIPHTATTDCRGWKPAIAKVGTLVSAKVLNNIVIQVPE